MGYAAAAAAAGAWFSVSRSKYLGKYHKYDMKAGRSKAYACERERDTPLWHRCAHHSEKSLFCDSGNGV